MTDANIKELINHCIAKVESDNVAGIVTVAQENKIQVTDIKYVHIIASQIVASGKYTKEFHNGQYYISKNPNYELTQNVIQTNNSIRELNDTILPKNFRIQKNLTIASIIVAASSALFVFASVYLQKTDTTSKELKDIRQTLQTQSKSTNSLEQTLKNIDSSVQKMVQDSVNKK